MEILMNAFFSYQDPETMVGSFLSGGYINNHHNPFNKNIEQGQAISQSLDLFIENHPVCQEALLRLAPKARKYGNRILRLYYDHLLARNWANYSEVDYTTFCEMILGVLKTHNHLFPYKPKRVVNRVVRKKLITSLSTLNGLNEYIQEMTRYNSYNSIVQESIGDLAKYYDTFNREFNLIFPQMEKEFLVKEKKTELLVLAS
jgi:acyl carrier protein phosphodiesterase